MPNVIDVTQIAQLFGTFVNNPVVVCFIGAIVLSYFVVVIWARRKDVKDTAKVCLIYYKPHRYVCDILVGILQAQL